MTCIDTKPTPKAWDEWAALENALWHWRHVYLAKFYTPRAYVRMSRMHDQVLQAYENEVCAREVTP